MRDLLSDSGKISNLGVTGGHRAGPARVRLGPQAPWAYSSPGGVPQGRPRSRKSLKQRFFFVVEMRGSATAARPSPGDPRRVPQARLLRSAPAEALRRPRPPRRQAAGPRRAHAQPLLSRRPAGRAATSEPTRGGASPRGQGLPPARAPPRGPPRPTECGSQAARPRVRRRRRPGAHYVMPRHAARPANRQPRAAERKHSAHVARAAGPCRGPGCALRRCPGGWEGAARGAQAPGSGRAPPRRRP